jgi:hypothetical protein
MVPRKGMKMGTGCGRLFERRPTPWLPPQLLAESPAYPMPLVPFRDWEGRAKGNDPRARRPAIARIAYLCTGCIEGAVCRFGDALSALLQETSRPVGIQNQSSIPTLTSRSTVGDGPRACILVLPREAADAVSTTSRHYGVSDVPSKEPSLRAPVNSCLGTRQPGKY